MNPIGITRFQAGQPLQEQLTAARLNSLIDAIVGNAVQTGVGYVATRNSGGTTLSMRPSFGGGSPSPILPLQITRTPPAGWDAEQNPIAVNDFFIKWGLANLQQPTGLFQAFTVAATTWFFVKIYLDEESSDLVTSAEILTGSTSGAYVSDDFGPDGEPPDFVVFVLGVVEVVGSGESTTYAVSNSGGGSLWVNVYLTKVECIEGGTKYTRRADIRRDG